MGHVNDFKDRRSRRKTIETPKTEGHFRARVDGVEIVAVDFSAYEYLSNFIGTHSVFGRGETHPAQPGDDWFFFFVHPRDKSEVVSNGVFDLEPEGDPSPGKATMAFFSQSSSPSTVYESQRGKLTLTFNEDRTHVTGSFAFDGVHLGGEEKITVTDGDFDMPFLPSARTAHR